MKDNPSIAFVGPGKVGCALAAIMQEKGLNIIGAATRPESVGEKKPGQEVFPYLTSDPVRLAQNADIIFITTPDDRIASIAEKLKKEKALKPEAILVHTSGHHPASILGDKNVLAMHPLLSMARWDLARENIKSAWFFLDGDQAGLEKGKDLAEVLGLNWTIIESGKKAFYHAAAVLFSNYLVALVNAGLELQQKAGISKSTGLKAALPLIESTLNNLHELGPVEALTGPVARGDKGTVEGHLKAMKEEKGLCSLYCELGLYTLEIARKKGLSPEAYRQMLKTLEEGITRG